MAMDWTFGTLDGTPAIWEAGVFGKVYVNGTWKGVDSMELVSNATVMSRGDFQRDYADAYQALSNTGRSDG